jgi:hypothetical protein
MIIYPPRSHEIHYSNSQNAAICGQRFPQHKTRDIAHVTCGRCLNVAGKYFDCNEINRPDAKQWRDYYRRFSDKLLSVVRHFGGRLPFGICDPERNFVIVSPNCVPIELMDFRRVRAALAACKRRERFPFAFFEAKTEKIIIPAHRISLENAIRVLSVYTAEEFEPLLKRILWDTEGLAI